MKLRAPAVPLITVDPYFSVWSPDTTLNAARTMHWTGAQNRLLGILNVDGRDYSFLGYHRNLHKMRQTSLDITAFSTTAIFEAAGVTLTAVFTTPLLPDDFAVMTRPVSYLALSYAATDDAQHAVKATVRAYEDLCLDRPGQSPVVTENVACGDLLGVKMGNSEQKPLNRSGDDLRIDWGYFYLTMQGKSVTADVGLDRAATVVSVSAPLSAGQTRLVLFGYDDGVSIEYFGKPLRSFWNKDGKTIETALTEAAADYADVTARCRLFSDRMLADARRAGGAQYAELLALAFRQVIAAHKLVLDENGEVLFISKECFSNGCAATVDVSYPSIPLFLLCNPELVKGMMRPIYRYAESDAWEFDFAPHDAGQYPLLNGQVYCENRREGQMPVEECGNMLIMEANVALATGDVSFAAAHMDLLERWCAYLLQYGRDPESQLCTDDFAGHLAHNCNLSLKAIMGVMAMSILMRMNRQPAKAAAYKKKAAAMAADVMARMTDANGETRLAFDQPGTYSMKYNAVWDRVWQTGLFGQEWMDAELAHNKAHFNAYGMPLDNRADYTKSDWLVWTASMASNKRDFAAFIAPLWNAYHVTENRVPLTDWYDTVTAREVGFQNRTVQGGLYMRLLMAKGLRRRK